MFKSTSANMALCGDFIYATPVQTIVVRIEPPRSTNVHGVMHFCCLCMVPWVGYSFCAFVAVHDQSC